MVALNKKYDEEWKQVGEYYSPWGPDRRDPKRNYPITPRENFERLLTGKKPVYMPVITDMLPFAPRIVPDNAVRAWALEVDCILPGSPAEGGPDMFGVEWQYVQVTGGSMVRPGNPKVKDIRHWEDYISFPDLDDWDWEGSAERNAKLFTEDRMNRVWLMNGLNERLISFMDFDKAMMAYVDEESKEGVHRLFDRLCTFYDDLIERFRKYYKCDVLMFNDDWGTKHGPQFSLDTAREMIVPYMRRIAESCHKRGMYLELHCCGKNDLLAPVIAESGVDIWVPQEIINDFELIYSLIGDKVYLGIPSDSTPEMSDSECLECAERFMEKFGKYGNVILNTTFPPQHPRIEEFLYYLSRDAYSAWNG